MTNNTQKIKGSLLFKLAAYSALSAAVLNVILFYAFSATGTIDPTILVNGQSIQVFHILMSSILPTFVAALVFLLIGRFSKRPWNIFKILSLVLLVLSFMNPFMGIPGITIGMGVVLNVMHVVVVLPIFYFFPKSLTDH